MAISTFGLSVAMIPQWKRCRKCGGLSHRRERNNWAYETEIKKLRGCKCDRCLVYPFDPYSAVGREVLAREKKKLK